MTKDIMLECPECEACCALGICCVPASEEHRVALTNLIIKDGKWTDPVKARAVADSIVKAYFTGAKTKHKTLKAAVAKIVA